MIPFRSVNRVSASEMFARNPTTDDVARTSDDRRFRRVDEAPDGDTLRGVDFSRVIGELAGFLEREDARFALAGAFALHAHGLSRATSDIDFVTEARIREPLVAFLESLGYETLYTSRGYSNHVHPDAAMGRVGLIYVDGETAERLFGKAGATLRLGGHVLRAPRAEHLAAMKVHAMKNDPSRTLQEMADIRYLLQLEGVDEEEIRGYFERAGLPEKFDEIRRSL